jgi:hypothetical protein
VPAITEGRDAVVPTAAARRLSNQIARVHSGTYGAGTGLRTLMRLASAQMLRAGSSREAVARALSDLVRNCPAPLANPALEINSANHATSLIAMTAECVSDVADEMVKQGLVIVPEKRELRNEG